MYTKCNEKPEEGLLQRRYAISCKREDISGNRMCKDKESQRSIKFSQNYKQFSFAGTREEEWWEMRLNK